MFVFYSPRDSKLVDESQEPIFAGACGSSHILHGFAGKTHGFASVLIVSPFLRF